MMDPVKIEKFQAMKRYKRRRRQLLPGLLKYTLAITLLGLFLSSPLWLPSLGSFLNILFGHVLPGVAAAALGPKCLFVMGNLIVIFLVGECKLLRPHATAPDIYQEYVNKQSSLRQQCEGKGKLKDGALEENVTEEEEDEDEDEEQIMDFNGEGAEEEEEAAALSELNQRSENLIARVNEQWRHESRMLL